IERVVVGDDESVTAPRFVLQRNGPDVTLLIFATQIQARELDVPPVRRQADPELLHALVENRKTDRRASTHQAISDCHEVEHFGDDARRQALSPKGDLAVSILASKRQ